MKQPCEYLPAPDESPAEVPLATLQTFTVRRPSEILAMEFSDDASLLGDFLIAEEQPMTFVGPGGAGKSRLLLQCATDMILGRPFIGFPTRGAGKKWLIIGTENSNRRFKTDLERLMAYAGDGWPTVDECLRLHTVENEDDGYVALSNPANAIRIESTIREINPAVIAFDPLNEFRMGELNNDEFMLNTCREISRLSKAGNPKRAWTVLHHTQTGRAGAAKAVGYDRASYSRNSKALHGWTRAQINLAPGSADNNDVLVVSCGKCSNGREFEPFAIRLNLATMIYEKDTGFDMGAWLAEFGGQKEAVKLVTIEDVRDECAGGKTRTELAKAVQAYGVSSQYAYRMVKKAELAKRIIYTKVTDRYVQSL